MLHLGIDLGGTRIKSVLLNSTGTVLQENYTPTQDDGEAGWKHTVKQVCDHYAAQYADETIHVGISAPGLPNASNTAIAYMPGRLQGLENFIWADWLQKPTYVLNDAVAALMAEARLGAGKGLQHVAMLTLGTGVGGALLLNGKPFQGAFNKAGHIGHMVIDSTGEPDVTGMPGSLEDAIGNVTVERRSQGRFTSTQLLLDAMRSGDSFAKKVWEESVRKLAMGIASITNIISPERIILGGGITEAGADLFDLLETYMALYEWKAGGNGVEIVKAQYGDLSGAIGAACFAMEKQ